MVLVRLKNVSVHFGKRFRHNQNYTLVLWKLNDGVDENTTIEDVKELIKKHYTAQVYLNKDSIVEIEENSYKRRVEQ